MSEQMDKRNLQPTSAGSPTQVIVVFGPKGCGKTRNRNAICGSLADRAYLLIDGVSVVQARASIEHNLRHNGPKTFIVMTHENVDFDMFRRFADDVRIISFDAAMARAQEGDAQ